MKNILIIFTLLISLVLSFFLIKSAWQKQELSYDLAEVEHVKYGLFDVQEWKIKATELIFKKLENTDLIGENKETIQRYVNQALYELVDQVEEYVNAEVRRGSGIEQLIKGVIRNVAFDADAIRREVPQWSENILSVIKNVANETDMKDIIKAKLSEFIDIDEKYQHDRLNQIYQKYQVVNKEAAIHTLRDKIDIESKNILYFGIPLLLISILFFAFLYRIDNDSFFYGMIGILVILIFVGVSIPMLQIEAKIDVFSFQILGEEIRFDDQVMFYQSKSILQVFRILIEDGRFLSIITALFIILFSVIFPASKLIASFLYKNGNDSPIVEFLCFKSGKWSMADVMVVAIFLSFIGIDTLLDSQMNSLSRTVDQLQVIASNDNSGLQFGILVFSTFVILSILFSIKLKSDNGYNNNNKYY